MADGRKMVTKIQDRYDNLIELTDERWQHIITYHPELEGCRDGVLEAIRKGVRRQDVVEPEKYKLTLRDRGQKGVDSPL